MATVMKAPETPSKFADKGTMKYELNTNGQRHTERKKTTEAGGKKLTGFA
jgi:hypothetical protein